MRTTVFLLLLAFGLVAFAQPYDGTPGSPPSDDSGYQYPCVPGPGSDAACTALLQSHSVLTGSQTAACAPQPGQTPGAGITGYGGGIPQYNCEQYVNAGISLAILSASVTPDPATWIQLATPDFFSYTQVGPNNGLLTLAESVAYSQSVTDSYSNSYSASLTISASYTVSASFIFASAKATAGVSVTGSYTRTQMKTETDTFTISQVISAGQGDCITAIGFVASVDDLNSNFNYTNFVTGTRNYTGPNGQGNPRTSFVTDMDNYVTEFLNEDVSPKNSLGDLILYTSDFGSLSSQLVQLIQQSDPFFNSSSPDGTFVIAYTSGQQSTSEGVFSTIASCPCSNFTCITGIAQTGGNTPPPEQPAVIPDVPGFPSPVGPYGPINYTVPYGAVNIGNVSILGLPNLAFTSTGPVFGEVVAISDM